MSVDQEVIAICIWGFVETRGRTPEVIEAYANTVEEFAVLDSMDRALEMGFSSADVRSSAPILAGRDDLGDFELRTFVMTNVELRGADSLFFEANDLVDAAWKVLSGTAASDPADDRFQQLRATLEAYERRWRIDRS